MSASSFTDWSVNCDYAGCAMSVYASELDMRGVDNATELRKVLKRRDWTVNVPAADVTGPIPNLKKRLDFCPDHKPSLEGLT